MTSDHRMIDIISNGIFIEFGEIPLQSVNPRQYNFNSVENEAILVEIDKLLTKGVIRQVKHCREYVSNIFVRPKKDSTYRMILNLKRLNESVVYHHFKMSTLQSAVQLMTKNCYMASIDWKDA